MLWSHVYLHNGKTFAIGLKLWKDCAHLSAFNNNIELLWNWGYFCLNPRNTMCRISPALGSGLVQNKSICLTYIFSLLSVWTKVTMNWYISSQILVRLFAWCFYLLVQVNVISSDSSYSSQDIHGVQLLDCGSTRRNAGWKTSPLIPIMRVDWLICQISCKSQAFMG